MLIYFGARPGSQLYRVLELTVLIESPYNSLLISETNSFFFVIGPPIPINQFIFQLYYMELRLKPSQNLHFNLGKEHQTDMRSLVLHKINKIDLQIN